MAANQVNASKNNVIIANKISTHKYSLYSSLYDTVFAGPFYPVYTWKIVVRHKIDNNAKTMHITNNKDDRIKIKTPAQFSVLSAHFSCESNSLNYLV